MFEGLSEASVEALARTCAPAIENLLKEEEHKDQLPLFASVIEAETKEAPFEAKGIIDKEVLEALPERYPLVQKAGVLYSTLAGSTGFDLHWGGFLG